MFTEESFRAVRDRLTPDGLLVIYNYFREKWLVDRLANTAAVAFGAEPWVHVHAARAYLGVMLAGPRLKTLTTDPVVPDRVTAFGQSHDPSPAVRHVRDAAIEPASDDWPFLYLRDRHVPRHYLIVVGLIGLVSAGLVRWTTRGAAGRWSWQMFLLGAGFMVLETRAITQFALLWGSTWIVASLAIASVLVMALVATLVVSKIEIRRPWLVGAVLLALLALNYAVPVGRVTFDSRVDRIGLLRAPAVQPDLLRRPAVRVGDQAVHFARARLRHQPPRRHGRRLRRIPLAPDRVQRPAGDCGGLLCRGRRSASLARPRSAARALRDPALKA